MSKRPKIPTLKPRIGLVNISKAPALTSSSQRLTGRRRQARNRRLQRENALCVHCEAVGRVSAATQWDHVVPLWKGGVDDESNLQGLCDECHSIKTAAEAREREQGIRG